MSPLRSGLVDSSSSDDSDSSSSLSDDSVEERLRAFARKIKAKLNPTERNPSMSRRNSSSCPSSMEGISVFRRPSLVAFDNNVEDTATPLPNHGNNNNTPKKSSLKARRLSLRNTLRKGVRKVAGKKNVSFVGEKQLFEFYYVETIAEIENVELIWFTPDELNGSKRDAQRLADALEIQLANLDGVVVDDEDWRGLESHSEEGHWKAYKARSDTINAVLDVQDEFKAPRTRRRQSSSAMDEITSMAQAAQEVSVAFAEEAAKRARQDAEYAKEYCRDIVAMIQAIPPPLVRITQQEQPLLSSSKDTPRSRSRRRMRFSITGSRQ
mmetsp:Transcript_18035/g.34450  ORF Transcript_18035/g.34450 Transcript_18035/m.34450 type:complete len:324 (+) Transcript_18035:230-1201(+)